MAKIQMFFKSLEPHKFVRTKMRPKEGTKIEWQRDLSDFVRFCQIHQLFRFRLVRFADFRNLKKKARWTDGWMDGRTDGQTDGRTEPFIEMRGRI